MRVINQVLQELAGYGIKIRDLLSAGVKDGLPIQPFTLTSDGQQIHLSSLREILDEIRKLGEQGLKLTRFKGLGEMNSDELGITAMDPKSRMLLQVTMQDAAAADEIFRVLMGDHVETSSRSTRWTSKSSTCEASASHQIYSGGIRFMRRCRMIRQIDG